MNNSKNKLNSNKNKLNSKKKKKKTAFFSQCQTQPTLAKSPLILKKIILPLWEILMDTLRAFVNEPFHECFYGKIK